MLKPTLNPVDTQFETLLQDLPVDLVASAREFRAFTRARKIKTPQELLRVVLLYCGLDQSLRTVAGNLTLLEERITDSSVRARLQACEPWVKALLLQLLPSLPALPAGYRLSVIDGSSVEAPGADGTDYRLHLRLELVSLTFLELVVTDTHTAESLRHFTLGAGDIALVDRGYCQPAALVETHQQGADWIVRWNSGIPLWTPTGEAFDLVTTLKQGPLTQAILTRAVQVGPAGSTTRVAAVLHACRLPAAGTEEGQDAQSSDVVPGRLGDRGDYPGTRRVDGRDDSGVIPGALASGTGDKTLEEPVESRPVTGQSRGDPRFALV